MGIRYTAGLSLLHGVKAGDDPIVDNDRKALPAWSSSFNNAELGGV